MRIEILTFEGCPNADSTRELVRAAVRLEAVNVDIEFIEVETPDLAQSLRFLGSPSVRVDGEDVEPAAKHRTAYGLMCRTYGFGSEASGTPSIAMIRAAIRSHAAAGSNASRDILENRALAGAVFWLPAMVLVASGFLTIGQGWRTGIWVAALTTMGVACTVNAFRCGRVHCYVTGPFFLITAIVALLYGLGLVPLDTHGWNYIGLTVLAGTILLCCLPEAMLGRYRRH